MAAGKRSKLSVLLEVGQWGLAVWLLWPVFVLQAGKLPIPRMMLGILLLVIGLGRLFYDSIFDFYKKEKERRPIISLLSMVITITLIAALIGGLLLLFAFYAASQLQQNRPED